MSLFTSGMNIATGKKYDTSKVSENVVTKAEITKKNVKLAQLFDKFDADKSGSLDSFEQAKMMDYFKSIESNGNNKVSKNELNAAAKELGVKGGDVKEFFKNFFNAIKKEQKVDGQAVKDFENTIERDKQITEATNLFKKELDAEVAEADKIVQDTKDAEANKNQEETTPALHSGKKMSVTNPNNPNGTIEGEMTVTATDENGMPASFTVKNEKTGNVFTYEYDKESGCYLNKKENKYYTLDENNNLVRDNKQTRAVNEIEEVVITAKAPDKAKLAKAKELGLSYTGAGDYYKKTDAKGNTTYYEWSEESKDFTKNDNATLVSPPTADGKNYVVRNQLQDGYSENYYATDGTLQQSVIKDSANNTQKRVEYSEDGKNVKVYDKNNKLIEETQNGEIVYSAAQNAQNKTVAQTKIKEMKEWIVIKNMGDGFTIRKEPGIFKMNPKCQYFDKDGNTYTQAEYEAIKNKK